MLRVGDVWYFGEDAKNHEDGELTDTSGSWETGVNGRQTRLGHAGKPKSRESLSAGVYAGEAEDMAEVLNLNATVDIGYGSFTGCLQTKEWTPLEPGIVEHKYYCKEVGSVLYENKVRSGVGEVKLADKY